MGLPIAALSDQELIHYAGIDEEAMLEMARRTIEHQGTYIREIDELKKQIDDLENQLSEAEDAAEPTDDLYECIQRVHDLLKDPGEKTSGELAEAVDQALLEMGDFAN